MRRRAPRVLFPVMDISEFASAASEASEKVRVGDAVRAPADERREALALLHTHEARAVVGYLWRRTGDSHAAEDLAADVFVRAFERLEDLRPGARSRAWLLRVATNLANRWARRRLVLGWISLASSDASALEGREPTSESVEVEALRAALLRLPPRFQAVLALHYIEELPVEQVARILELPVGTVHSRLSRGRARLRRQLERS